MNYLHRLKLFNFNRQVNILFLEIIALLVFIPIRGQETGQYPACYFAKSEKVFVQLDQAIYVAGSMMNYKVFMVNASNLQQEWTSKVIYFELADGNNRVVMNWRINFYNENGAGSVQIPADIRNGIYTLYAYTNWMRNGSPDYLSSKKILITTFSNDVQLDTLLLPTAIISNKEVIRFYPEGGQMIQGLKCRIGYKLLHVNYPSDIPESIVIMDNDSNVVQFIHPGNYNVGSFYLLPEKSKIYSAILNYMNGDHTIIKLPQAVPNGYLMKIQKETFGFSVILNSNVWNKTDLPSYELTAYIHGEKYFSSKLTIDDSIKKIQVPVKEPLNGIFQVILTGIDGEPVCQRLYYYAGNKPSINFTSVKNQYSVSQDVKIGFKVDNLNGLDTADLTVSVREIAPFDSIVDNYDINSYLNLYAEIKNISGTGILNANDTEDRVQDILLCTDLKDYAWNILTHWNQSLQQNKEDLNYILTGKIINKNNGNSPLPGVHVVLSNADSTSSGYVHALTDTSGRFNLYVDKNYESKKLRLRVSMDAGIEFDSINLQDSLKFLVQKEYPRNRLHQNNYQTCQYQFENRSYVLSGRVEYRNSSPLIDAKVMLSPVDSMFTNAMYTLTDSTGNFRFLLNKAYDNKKLVLQVVNNEKKSAFQWEIDNKEYSASKKYTKQFFLSDNDEKYIRQYKDIALIHAIYNKTTEEQELKSKPFASNFYGQPSFTVYPSDYIDLVNFKEIADNIIPTVRFFSKDKNYVVELFDPLTKAWTETQQVWLNGVYFDDLGYISTLSSKDIRKIDVYSSPFFEGELTFNGVVAIYTYDGQIPKSYLNTRACTFENTVLPAGNSNWNSNAISNTGQSDNLPDFRSELYWNPDFKIGSEENKSINFKTSRLKTTYIISIQGITDKGIPISSQSTFVVK